MNKKLYCSLAKNNIRKNKSTFYPFALSAMTMIALFFMIFSIRMQVSESNGFYGMRSIEWVLHMGVWICGIFASGVIFYTNRFLIKQRSKELGLYSILGMEKKHIAKVVFWELAILGIFSIAAGMGFGILFSRLMFLLLVKMLKINAAISFGISWRAIGSTLLLFGLVFAANITGNVLCLQFMKPIDLLKSENYGEREPKARWLQAMLALVCLGTGYYIAVTTESPLQAINLFFIAVILVMAGTHLLFLSGSVALLKLLKKNKRYYFHKTHFITVSGMMYRMKRNAAGLANICILSTAVLIIVSTTISLYTGVQDVVAGMYPRDVQAEFQCLTQIQRYKLAEETGTETEAALDEEAIERTIAGHAKKHAVQISNVCSKFSLFAIAEDVGNNVFLEMKEFHPDEMILVSVVSQQEYNSGTDIKEKMPKLSKGEVWIWDSTEQVSDGEEITLCGAKFRARVMPRDLYGDKEMQMSIKKEYAILGSGTRGLLVFVPSRQELEQLTDQINAATGDGNGGQEIAYEYLFDVDGDEANVEKFCGSLRDCFNREGIPHVTEVGNRFKELDHFEGMYASVFFIGLFIGTMFLLATVLIIYYKQVSEGFEDRGRFEILQKVGMDQKEVKKVITTQILQVFFLPILLATVHIGFAFPIVRRILAIMGFINVRMFVGCTVVSILVFAAVYGMVYYLTARVYYRIVYGK